ncbi:capsule assembly Wzi family protein [Candidatus Neomarinimicrobiota bacterium]
MITRIFSVLIILINSNMLWGQDIKIEPIVFGIYKSSGDIWQVEDNPVSFAGWGVKGNIAQDRWQLEVDLILMRFFGLTGLPNRFSPEQGFSWKQHATGTVEEFDTDYTSMKLTYQVGGFTAMLGKYSQSWGPGLHSLTISDKPPTYPQFGFDWWISDNLHFSYLHGDLFSGLQSQSVDLDSSLFGSRKVYLDRYVAAHRLEWQPFDGVTVGVLESVVYGGRGIETIYLMPVMSFWSAQHYMGDTDNVQMSADLSWQLSQTLKLYGVFLMDEWRPQSTFKKTNRNWFAWQGGFELRSIIGDQDYLAAEATWTDHRINRHRFPINDFYSHDYPLGHWIGPHAQSLMAYYLLPRWGYRFMLSYLYAKRGELTDEMITDQYNTIPYERFSGNTETIQNLDVIVTKPVWRKLWLEIAVSHCWWANAGFNPASPATGNLEDISKTSLNVGFYYNFNLPGYPITLIRSLDPEN